MGKLDYYMSLNYPLLITKDTKGVGYCISFPDLPGCIACCDKFDEILETANDAKKKWLITRLEGNMDINAPNDGSMQYGLLNLQAPRDFYDKLENGANKEGVPLNDFCIYQLTKEMREIINEQEKVF